MSGWMHCLTQKLPPLSAISMFADLVSVAGHIYKHGVMDGLPQTEENPAINLHCDEFSELMGDEFIPLINKGGGAGVEVTAYTQTLSDMRSPHRRPRQSGPGRRQLQQSDHDAGAGICHRRIVDEATAAGGCAQQQHQFRRCRQRRRTWGNISFSSNTQDRMSSIQVPLLEPASLVQLPKGQAFASAGRWSALEATHPITGRSTRSADAGKHHTHSPLYGKTVRQHAHMVGPPGDSCNGEK